MLLTTGSETFMTSVTPARPAAASPTRRRAGRRSRAGSIHCARGRAVSGVPASARDSRSSDGSCVRAGRRDIAAAGFRRQPPQHRLVQPRLRHFQIDAADQHRPGRRADRFAAARRDRVDRDRRPADRTASPPRSGRPAGSTAPRGSCRFSPFGAVISIATSALATGRKSSSRTITLMRSVMPGTVGLIGAMVTGPCAPAVIQRASCRQMVS